MNDDEALADDMTLYGSCYWRFVDGKRVRVPIEDVRYINGIPMQVDGDVVNSAERSQSTSEENQNHD